MMNGIRNIFQKIEWEAAAWTAGLVYLLFIDPYKTEHISLCPYKNLGIDFCPGCGLGKSIAFLYHGDIINSFHAHPLALPALILISYRIIHLVRRKYFINHNYKEVIYG